MAESEYDILRTLRHEHILKAQNYADELGPTVLFRREPDEIRLDQLPSTA